jgi:hypothetical protein
MDWRCKKEAERYIKVHNTSYVVHTMNHWRTWCFHVTFNKSISNLDTVLAGSLIWTAGPRKGENSEVWYSKFVTHKVGLNNIKCGGSVGKMIIFQAIHFKTLSRLVSMICFIFAEVSYEDIHHCFPFCLTHTPTHPKTSLGSAVLINSE